MSHGNPQVQAVAGALSLMAQMVRHGQSLQHEQSLAALRNAGLANALEALVTKRVDAVQQSFEVILGQYAEQARHFMAQQKTYSDKELDCDDPLKRVQLRSRIQTIDIELATIRAEAKLLFDRMTEVIMALGGSSSGFVADVAQPLMLPGGWR